jgi:hypothetical protein
MADYVLEHRLRVAKALGRPLTSTEVVHHRDGDVTNNDLPNLHLFASQGHHARHHNMKEN